jgi:DNA-binding NarL/FixJ family response regulator
MLLQLSRQREQQIEALLREDAGYSDRELAQLTGARVRTVKQMLVRIARRWGLPQADRLQLAAKLEGIAYIRFIRIQGLSWKQQRIAYWTARGMQNAEIARRVGTTEHVVKNYLRIVYERTGMATRYELASWYRHRARVQKVSTNAI